MMRNETLLDTLYPVTHNLPEPMLDRVYFFHDIRLHCQTNQPAILTILDDMLGGFPRQDKLRGEANYYVLCYENASHFPIPLPHDRIRTGSIRLLTQTKLKYYRSRDYTTEYQSYEALPTINEAALSVIKLAEHAALTQLVMLEAYESAFLRRYLFLIALGQLMNQYGFEPFHAAAITDPWDKQQGALIIGASGSGKTTLSLGCAKMGCGLLGDDLVMLHEDLMDGTISAYAITQEVSVRSGTLALWHDLAFLRTSVADQRDKRYCSIEQIRTGATRLQTPIRLLIFPSLTDEGESRVTLLSKASTLQELVDQCMSRISVYPQTQEKLFSLLSKLAEQAIGYQLAIARGDSNGPQIIRSLFAGGAL